MPEKKPKTPDDAPTDKPTDDITDSGLHRIQSVEIFSIGEWNGDGYKAEDLDEMVRAFEENKEHVRPFLKLGHSEDQRLLEAEGMPAAGWVESVYRKGDKLMADFFGVDRDKIEAERRALLDAIREANSDG